MSELPNPEISQEDDEMPEPKVKTYQDVCVLLPKFNEILLETLGKLGYNQVVGTVERNFQVNQVFKLVEQRNGRVPIDEMNQIIALVSLCPYNLIQPFMKLIETPEGQKTLWVLEQE